MTGKSMIALEALNEQIERRKYLADLNSRELVNDLDNVEMPDFMIDDIINYLPTLIQRYDAEIDAAAKKFVETWLDNDGGNDETAD